MNSQISSYLQDLFELLPSGITRLGLDYKITSGIKTDETSIVFGVQKKLPLNELSGSYIIPKTLQFDNMVYKTDVIEAGRAFYIPACHNPNANPLPAIIQSHRSGHRPLKGGISLVCQSNNRLLTGTLGLICIDNVSSGFVGLTNAHVALGPEHYIFGPNEFNYNNVNKRVVQKTETNSEVSSDTIGNVYKFFPTLHGTESNTIGGERNYIDAALFTIRKCNEDGIPTIDNTESFKQLNIDYPYPMKFATTEEIDNIFGTNTPLFHAGRTTGPKGQVSCPLRITGLSPVQIEIGDIESSHIAKYFDIIGFAYADGANHPVSGGDSGSVLIANLSGEYKIIGLVFAGQVSPTPNIGYACRIDNVANLLNISAWDGLSYPHLSYPPKYYTTSTGYFIRETVDKDTKNWNITFKDHSFAGFADFTGILNAITASRDLTGVPISCYNFDNVYQNMKNNFVEHKMTYNITSDFDSFVVDDMPNPTFRFVRDIGDLDTQSPGDPWRPDYGASYTLNINAGGHKVWIKTWPVTGTDYIFTSGVTNNGAANGSIVIKIPDYDDNFGLLPWPSPHILYYVSETNPRMKGKIFTYQSLDPGADEDGDGVDNFSEIENSTNPFVSNNLSSNSSSSSISSSSSSSILLTTLASPNTPITTNATRSGFNVLWNSIPNATGYSLDISTDKRFVNILSDYNNKIINNTGISITGLNTGTHYFTRVKSLSGVDESPYSFTQVQTTAPYAYFRADNWSTASPQGSIRGRVIVNTGDKEFTGIGFTGFYVAIGLPNSNDPCTQINNLLNTQQPTLANRYFVTQPLGLGNSELVSPRTGMFFRSYDMVAKFPDEPSNIPYNYAVCIFRINNIVSGNLQFKYSPFYNKGVSLGPNCRDITKNLAISASTPPYPCFIPNFNTQWAINEYFIGFYEPSTAPSLSYWTNGFWTYLNCSPVYPNLIYNRFTGRAGLF